MICTINAKIIISSKYRCSAYVPGKLGVDYPKFVYIRSIRDMKKKGFTKVPNALLLDERISNDAKMLFCYIQSLSVAYRKLRNRTLMQRLGVSINTLQKCKEELIKYKYLTTKRLTSANFYYLRLPKNYTDTMSNSDQSDYPKTTQHYKSKTITNNTITNKGFKRLKKFDE